MPSKPITFAEYAAAFPPATQQLLRELRATISDLAPAATETISYGMPAFKLNGALVFFGAYARHLGFYPSGSAIATFKEELTPYKHAKGSIQFPLDQPLPLDLITRIVKFRVTENLQKSAFKNGLRL